MRPRGLERAQEEQPAEPAPGVVDYADPLHVQQAHGRSRHGTRETTPGGQILLAAATGTVFVAVPMYEFGFAYVMYGWFVWTVAGTMFIGNSFTARRTHAPVAGPAGWRGWLMALALATLVLGARFERCPHATYVWLGPVPLVFGDPCDNPRHYRNVLEHFLTR